MDILKTLRLHLGDKNHAYQRKVAEAIGVSYFTLRKIVRGYTRTISYENAELVRAYYERAARKISLDDLAENRLSKKLSHRKKKVKPGEVGPLRQRSMSPPR